MNKYVSYFIVGVAGLFILVLIATIFQFALQPKSVNWNTSFSKNSKQPFGTKIFHEQLHYLFPGNKIRRLGKEDLESYYYDLEDQEDDEEQYEEVYDDFESDDNESSNEEKLDSILAITYDVEVTVDSSKLKKRSYEENLPDDELEDEHEEQRVKSIAHDSLSVLTEKALEELNIEWDNEEEVAPNWLDQFNDTELDTSFNVIGVASNLVASNWKAKDLVFHVAKGNNAYLSFQHYPKIIKNLIGFTVSSNTSKKSFYTTQSGKKSLSELLDENKEEEEVLVAPQVLDFTFTNGNKFHLDSITWTSYFDTIPKNAEVLGTNDSGDVVLFKLNIGNGSIFLSTLPHVFSNYEMLKKNSKIAEDEMLRLPNRNTYYFDRLTMTRSSQNSQSPSLLTFIHSQPPLAWAFYILMFGLGVFLLLQIRRSQRPLPIINPPQNLSLGYISTLSDLFYRKKDNRLILKRKMEYFIHQIQTNYHLDTRKLDPVFFEKLSIITGVSKKQVTQLFKIYESLESREKLDEHKFQAFNRLIQLFKK